MQYLVLIQFIMGGGEPDDMYRPIFSCLPRGVYLERLERDGYRSKRLLHDPGMGEFWLFYKSGAKSIVLEHGEDGISCSVILQPRKNG